MSAAPGDGIHGAEMAQPEHAGLVSCADRNRGSLGIDACKGACADLVVLPPPPGGPADDDFTSAPHELRPATLLVSRSPGLNEHPPELRLS